MAHTSDGGPAFPQSVSAHDGGATASYDFVDGSGMSLRDYFAAKALAGMHARDGYDEGQRTPDQRARLAYIDADAMLRARDAQTPAERQAEHLKEFGK